MNSVAVVVLNYKGISDTVDCLASLSRQTYQDFVIVAVENGSHDGSAEEFQKLEKQYGEKLVTLYNKKNLGFDGGANSGIRWAIKNNFDYVALLNNDATADEDWLKLLVSSAQAKKSSITTGLLVSGDGKTIDSSGEQYSKWGLPFPRNRGDSVTVTPPSDFVTGATGGASLYSISALKHIGLFDEDFFAYYEDTDISLRAQLAGYSVYYESKAIAYHKLSQTSSRMPSGFVIYQMFKNLPLVYIKNVPLRLLVPIGIRFYLAYWLMLGNAITHGSAAPALKGAFISIILGVKKVPSRWRIQRSKKISAHSFKNILWDDLPPDQSGIRKVRRVFIGK